MKILNSIPKEDGFRMPGEFEEHEATYIIWPERTDNWRYGAKPAQEVFIKVANCIAKYENVTVLVSQKQYNNARELLDDKVRVIETSSDDSWVRDCGPSFIIKDNLERRAIDWGFDAWGGLEKGLYFPWNNDDILGSKIADIENTAIYKLDNFILEGGSFHVDGEGTVITTEECLIEGRRNNLSKDEIEKILCDYLNCTKVLWLKSGIYNDETSGHIDNICTFVKPGVVVLAWTDDISDPQYQRSLDAFEYLSNHNDARGRKLEIHKIHLPSPILITKEESKGVDSIDGTLPRKEGDRLAASYINYYVGNGFVCLPIFNDPNDQAAIDKLKELFPDRTIETIYAREILLGGGNIHCITQQVPKI
ncbi:MAG: agmatine deiminase [bacterium]